MTQPGQPDFTQTPEFIAQLNAHIDGAIEQRLQQVQPRSPPGPSNAISTLSSAMKALPFFDGGKKGVTAKVWVQQVKDVFDTIGPDAVTERQKILSAGLRLKGQALDWYTCGREQFLTPGTEIWEGFEVAFLEEFQPDRATLEQELREDRQKETESFSTFATRYRIGCIGAFDSETKNWPGYITRQFLRGVRDSTIKQYLMTLNIDHPDCSFHDMVTAGVKMERHYGPQDLDSPSPVVPSRRAAARNQPAAETSLSPPRQTVTQAPPAETPGMSDLISRMDRLVVLTENHQRDAAQMRPPNNYPNYPPYGPAPYYPEPPGRYNQGQQRGPARRDGNNRWGPQPNGPHRPPPPLPPPQGPANLMERTYGRLDPAMEEDDAYHPPAEQEAINYEEPEVDCSWAFLKSATEPEAGFTWDNYYDYPEPHSAPAYQASPMDIDQGNRRPTQPRRADNGRYMPLTPPGVTPSGVRPLPIEPSSGNRTSNVTPSTARPLPAQDRPIPPPPAPGRPPAMRPYGGTGPQRAMPNAGT